MIKDKVVIITGASSGIGAATAMLLAQKGAKLVLGARREEKLQQIVNKIKENGGEAIYRITDVTNLDDSKKLVKAAKDTFGKVDVIFLNAGLMPSSEIDKLKIDEWNKTVDVNVKGVLNGIAAAIHTELLSTITDPDAAKAMQTTYNKYQIGPDRVANVVAFAIDQPEDTNVSEFTVGPTNQPW
ncbi:putative oxidoreductase [Companilactobacillus paralimentarius]|uniref:SDR family oxidoreductase n=1 Tax=Companilactobacillus paralimentarius TaxID=83526 RepID=UPI00384FE5A2